MNPRDDPKDLFLIMYPVVAMVWLEEVEDSMDCRSGVMACKGVCMGDADGAVDVDVDSVISLAELRIDFCRRYCGYI
jgi:hypothetical protein